MALSRRVPDDIAADAVNLRESLNKGGSGWPAVPEPGARPGTGYRPDIRSCKFCHAPIAASGPRPDWACLVPQPGPALRCPEAPGDFPLHEPAGQGQ